MSFSQSFTTKPDGTSTPRDPSDSGPASGLESPGPGVMAPAEEQERLRASPSAPEHVRPGGVTVIPEIKKISAADLSSVLARVESLERAVARLEAGMVLVLSDDLNGELTGVVAEADYD